MYGYQSMLSQKLQALNLITFEKIIAKSWFKRLFYFNIFHLDLHRQESIIHEAQYSSLSSTKKIKKHRFFGSLLESWANINQVFECFMRCRVSNIQILCILYDSSDKCDLKYSAENFMLPAESETNFPQFYIDYLSAGGHER